MSNMLLKSPAFAAHANDSPAASKSGDIDEGPRPKPTEYTSSSKIDGTYMAAKLYTWCSETLPDFGNGIFSANEAALTEEYKEVGKQGGRAPETLTKFLRCNVYVNHCASVLYSKYEAEDIKLYDGPLDTIVRDLNSKC